MGHKCKDDDIYGSLVIPKLAVLTMMDFFSPLQSHREQKSTKTSCEEALEECQWQGGGEQEQRTHTCKTTEASSPLLEKKRKLSLEEKI